MPDTLPEAQSQPVAPVAGLQQAVADQAPALLRFLQRLIQTPGLPGAEGDTAALVVAEMKGIGFDDVDVDAAGNVIGLLRGRGGASVMLSTHLDHVDVGDPVRWPLPPFDGAVRDGAVWGRGAMDIKGPLACQVHAVAVLRRLGLLPAGDLYVTCTVMEEVGGVGGRVLLKTLIPDVAVVGEATGCRVARGHRGRGELEVVFRGRSAHASAPERGANPHFAAARFVAKLHELRLADSPELGSETVVPTLYRTDQASPNVIPSEVVVTLDWRLVPERSAASAVAAATTLAAASVEPGITAEARLRTDDWRTYTGLEVRQPSEAPAFLLAADDPLVTATRRVLETALGRPVPDMLWQFATDGGHYAAAGVRTVGFGPGNEHLAHTVEERIGLDELHQGLAGNTALAARLGEMDV